MVEWQADPKLQQLQGPIEVPNHRLLARTAQGFAVLRTISAVRTAAGLASAAGRDIGIDRCTMLRGPEVAPALM